MMQFFAAICLFLGSVVATLPKVKINSDQLFEDSEGRVRIFHGTSFVDKGFELIKVTDEQMSIFKNEWGLNFARIGILWDLIETTPGVYNMTYLHEVASLVRRFHDHGIYVMLDMHQDVWARQYCGHGFPDFYSMPDPDPMYKRGGAFAFPKPIANPKYKNGSSGDYPPITNCGALGSSSLGWISGYLTFALASGVERLYKNKDGYMDRFGDFWQLVASTVSNQSNVVGYELINEPWMGNVWRDPSLLVPGVGDHKNMEPLYEYIHKRIRTVDNDSVIFYESGYAGNFYDRVGFKKGVGGEAYKDRRALSYHMYCPMLQADLNQNGSIWHWIYEKLGWSINMDCNIAFAVGVVTRQRDIKRLGGGGLMTEFGALPDDLKMGVNSANYLMNEMDSLLSGWVYWLIVPSREANPDMVKLLARPYPHAIAGKPTKLKFNPDTSSFSLTYTPSRNNGTFALPTEIFVSKKYTYPNGFNVYIVPPTAASYTYDEATGILKVVHKKKARQLDNLRVMIMRK